MSQTNADLIGAQQERLRPVLQPLYETTYGVGSMIQRAGENFQISTWSQTLSDGTTLSAFRIPVKRYQAGDIATFNYDEGDMGSGSAMKVDRMEIGYFPVRYAIELSSLSMEATATSQQAVVNVFKAQVKDAIKEAQHYFDTSIHQDGTGVLATGNGTGSPAISGGSITYNLEANFGPQRLRLNQPVDIYSSDLTTKKNTGVIRVASYSFTAKTVTLTVVSGTINSPANTDRICFSGMSATLAVGSWMNGAYVFQSSATSGLTLQLDRTVVPELVTPNVNGNNAQLSPAIALLGQDQLRQRRDENVLNGVKGICHQSQRAAWYFQGLAISEWFRNSNDKMIDLVPKDVALSTTFQMAGVDHVVSKKQDRSRVDWIFPSVWARVMLHELKWFQAPDGRKWFESRNATTANPQAGFLTYLIATENIASADPGCGVLYSSLALPSGY